MANKAQNAREALDIEVLKQFRTIFKSVRKHFQTIEDACGVSGAQLWALARIAAEPGLRVSALAKSLAIHQSTASNLVERLAEQGLVERERSDADHRVVHLNLSEAGAAMLANAPGPVQGLLPDALSKLPAERLAVLHGELQNLLDLMSHIEPSAQHIMLGEM